MWAKSDFPSTQFAIACCWLTVLFYMYSAWNSEFFAITQNLSSTFSLKWEFWEYPLLLISINYIVCLTPMGIWDCISFCFALLFCVNHPTFSLRNKLCKIFLSALLLFFLTKMLPTSGSPLSSLLGRSLRVTVGPCSKPFGRHRGLYVGACIFISLA